MARVTGQIIQETIELYQYGYTIRELADIYGTSTKTIYQRLASHGVPIEDGRPYKPGTPSADAFAERWTAMQGLFKQAGVI